MEFWSTILGLIRRAVVIIPAFLVAATLGTLAYLGTPETYVSSTTMVLATTEYGGSEVVDPTEPTQLVNPMLNFNGSLQTTSAILIQTMGTKGILEQLGANGGGTQLIVNDGRTNVDLLGLNGPFLYIEGRSTSAEDAQRVVVDAKKVMQKKLGEWQRALNAPQKTYVSLVDVVPPTAPEADSGRTIKMGVLAFLFGFVLCVGIAYFGHQIRARRRARVAAAPAVLDKRPPLPEVPQQRQSPPHPPSSGPSPDGHEGAGSIVVPTAVPKEAGPAVPMTTPRTRSEPTFVRTTSRKKDESTHPTLQKTASSAVVRAPVKVNGRSRNR